MTPALTFSSSQDSVSSGDNVVLSWETTGADRCAASGAWDGRRDVTGQSEIMPTAPGLRTYELMCSNEVGDVVQSVDLLVE